MILSIKILVSGSFPGSRKVCLSALEREIVANASPGAKVHKRPLLHPAIPSPFSGKQDEKVVYIRSLTPFMSAFRRVQKLLAQADKRAMQSAFAQKTASANLRSQDSPKVLDEESVYIRATGKAIDKALNLGLFIQNQNEYAIRIRTGTVNAIDDIINTDAMAHVGSDTRIRRSPMLEIAVKLELR